MAGILGLLITFAGFLICVFGLSLTASVGGRMVAALVGIAVSLVGILVVVNKAFLKNAIWRR